MKKWKSNDKTVVVDDLVTVNSGDKLVFAGGKDDFVNFELTGLANISSGSTASLLFHNDGGDKGYEILFHNGTIDGSRKTGSLSAVRNLYKSQISDDKWFPFSVAVRGKNIAVKIDGEDVVCYTEPENPYRISEYKNRILSSGNFVLKGYEGKVDFKELIVKALSPEVVNPNDTMPPMDEQNDPIIRLQQVNFPVIDYHVHIKGGLTSEMAHARSMAYGINFGIAPNAYGPVLTPGEGGSGKMYENDSELAEYHKSVEKMPFLLGLQGEGRKWLNSFSKEALLAFDYLFTDGMTIIDHKGRLVRTYRPEEVIVDIPKEAYMDMLVDKTAKILAEEPADFFANAFYLPDVLSTEYDKYWTDSRIDKILDVMATNNIALEISARYEIPSKYILQRAKDKGLKFVFGTNNAGPEYYMLKYCAQMVNELGLTSNDIWFPSMSTRKARLNLIK
ncbi:family 16 glycoside hydrolase [Massilibacteroides sp.]|uniref:family 16 glycoside hydrolase n=1 Tax=Massilibacteroides sp. TaxID=2034766 RepID=UPI002622A73B|nr:family 16 glycoside hydrolase [Massilibacteroides sp.]MDD4516445.1 DUF1080 domain-containing protein [Massilibacteroides sp.]